MECPVSASAMVGGTTLLVPMAGLIDAAAEVDRLSKVIRKNESDIARLRGKLGNESFVKNAKPELVEADRARLAELEAQNQGMARQLERVRRMVERKAASEQELDTARAQFDVAAAQIARTKAIIARKTIRAPFRAVIGISDVHEGQYLNEGSQLTTLQGVDDEVYVDFTVAQQVAASLRGCDAIESPRARRRARAGSDAKGRPQPPLR